MHGVVDLGAFLGLTDKPGRRLVESGVKDAGRLVSLNSGLQSNAALLIDKLQGLRNPASLKPNPECFGAKPHFVGQQLVDL